MNTFNHDFPPGLAPGYLTVESGTSDRAERTDKLVDRWDDRSATQIGGWTHPLKAQAEWTLVFVVFLATLPLVALAYLIVRLTSPGSGIYSQNRVGLNGKEFLIYKLRSMYNDCERWSGPKWAEPSDPRVTPFGRFLRSSHLDELPQLWNVLRGDMALVGPRPERPEIVAILEAEIPQYRDRELIRPGVTGLAQIQLPPDTDIESVRRKLAYDLYYIREANALLDLKILIATGLKVVGVRAANYSRWLQIPTAVTNEGGAGTLSEQNDKPLPIHTEVI